MEYGSSVNPTALQLRTEPGLLTDAQGFEIFADRFPTWHHYDYTNTLTIHFFYPGSVASYFDTHMKR